MAALLIDALHAAEMLAAHHRRLADNTVGAAREYHLDMLQRCVDDIEKIRQRIAAGGATPARQDNNLRQRDVATAQSIIARHVLPEWAASEEAQRLLADMAQEIADAIQAARGGYGAEAKPPAPAMVQPGMP
jgi:hypothetical protein